MTERKSQRKQGGSSWVDATFRGNSTTKDYFKVLFERKNKSGYELKLAHNSAIILWEKKEMVRLSYDYIEVLRTKEVYAADELLDKLLV